MDSSQGQRRSIVIKSCCKRRNDVEVGVCVYSAPLCVRAFVRACAVKVCACTRAPVRSLASADLENGVSRVVQGAARPRRDQFCTCLQQLSANCVTDARKHVQTLIYRQMPTLLTRQTQGEQSKRQGGGEPRTLHPAAGAHTCHTWPLGQPEASKSAADLWASSAAVANSGLL